MFEKIIEGFTGGSVPNKFTYYMGDKVREARKENFMTQKELAKKTYLRQAAISDIENGKREVSTSELMFLCFALGKPASYFYPPHDAKRVFPNDLDEKESELILLARRVYKEDLDKLIMIARAFRDDTYRTSPD